jgi:hypothetical protein
MTEDRDKLWDFVETQVQEDSNLYFTVSFERLQDSS